MAEKLKIRIKETGKIDYCYDVIERDGFREMGERKIPKFKHTYFKNKELTETINKDDIDIIPWEPYELFGIECGKGWHGLLNPIFDYIEKYNKDKDDEHKMQIFQIKEKWGQLCVYLNFYTDEISKLIDTAEEEASNTCELCGSKENVGMAYEGWLTTECHDCMKKWCQKNERPHRWKRNSDNKIYWINANTEDELFENKEI